MNMTHYVGERFDRLFVLKFSHRVKNRFFVLCRCDCGTEKLFATSDLKSGRVHSCGCLLREMCEEKTKNKIKNIRLHYIYLSIKKRCFSSKAKSYRNYGARGITMCPEWADKKTGYRTFEKWAIEHGYKQGLSIDRINNDGDYEPSNCRWATNYEQSNNKRTNHIITVNDKQYTLRQAQDTFGIHSDRIRARLKAGWSTEEAVFTPVDTKYGPKKTALVE